MLAVNFLSASDLGLTEKEREAHIKVLRMLETGELPHCGLISDSADPMEFRAPYPPRDAFNMATSECGTVRCIGGWVASLLRVHWIYVNHSHGRQRDLYYPPLEADYNTITADQAASALRNYLTVGEPKWAEVLGF